MTTSVNDMIKSAKSAKRIEVVTVTQIMPRADRERAFSKIIAIAKSAADRGVIHIAVLEM